MRTCSLTVAAADRRGKSRRTSWDRAPGGGGASGAQRILGAGRSRGGRDWSGARERGGRSQGLGLGGGVKPHFVAAGGAGTPGRSAAAITDFLWDKRTGLAARTVSARAGGPRVRAERWRPLGGRGRLILGARDRGEIRRGRGLRPAKRQK